MDNKKRWLRPVIAVVIIAAICVGGYFIVQNMLTGRGVSAQAGDIQSVMSQIKTPLIIIGIVLLALLIIWIVVDVMNIGRKVKLTFRIQSLVAALIVLAIMANVICSKPAVSSLLNMTMGTTSKTLNKEEPAEKPEGGEDAEDAEGTETASGAPGNSKELSIKIAEEGIVLLKNEDNLLPLTDLAEVNVFGWSSTNPLYGGTGSGEFSDTSSVVTLLQGLEDAGFVPNQEIVDYYVDFEDTRPEIGMYLQDWTIPEDKLKNMNRKDIFENAQAYSDTAFLVISRSGGEGADLPRSITDENTLAQGATTGRGVQYTKYKDDVDPSKHYLELTNREIALVEELDKDFENIVVIINSANTMELGWVDQYEHIKSVVWCAGAGETGFKALGEILRGTVNPSGHTVDTYLYDLTAAPTWNNFGDFAYDNADDLVNTPGSEDNYLAHFVNYVEGIYVGYRFYETAAAEGLINYDEVVQYPFGYGLSYTTFEQKIESFEQDENTVSISVTVTNTGETAGKEVVEVYYTPPYTNGGIEKSAVNLIDFAKTGILDPGASETVTITFDMDEMASYDYLGAGTYVLEKGEYEISVRSDSHTVLDSRTFTLDADVVYGEDNLHMGDVTAAKNRFDFADGGIEYLSRKDHFANYESATKAPESFSMSDAAKDGFITNATFDITKYAETDLEAPTTGAGGNLQLTDLVGLAYTDPQWDKLMDQLTVDELSTLINYGGYMTAAVASIGLDQQIETDGPSGLHSNFTDLEGTSFPAPVILASTWNKELARARGEQIGYEGQELGITGWYGPAMNIHRSAFSGRNFEYYSEDPILSGRFAAEETAGAREYGMQTYIKHFALNDQETWRTGMLLTWSNEQAIREIYLKPFEMAVKDGGSHSVMTSYNYIGNQWAGACDALLNGVLRDEWGFTGVVATDWFGGYGYMNSDLAIINGGDRMLTNTGLAKNEDTTSAAALNRMRTAGKNILFSLVNSSIMKDVEPKVSQADGDEEAAVAAPGTSAPKKEAPMWKKLLTGITIGIIVICVLLEVLYLVKMLKKKKDDEGDKGDEAPAAEA